MDPKAQALLQELARSFGNCHVEYQFANELHKFRLEWGPTHWLYVSRTFVDDHTEQELLGSLAHWRIPDTFRASQQSRWLFLGEGGVREVNDAFGRGNAL
jgi:hypothetical protein